MCDESAPLEADDGDHWVDVVVGRLWAVVMAQVKTCCRLLGADLRGGGARAPEGFRDKSVWGRSWLPVIPVGSAASKFWNPMGVCRRGGKLSSRAVIWWLFSVRLIGLVRTECSDSECSSSRNAGL